MHLFRELRLQHAFLQHPTLMTLINATYAYVHIPATVLFLICLFHNTITSPTKGVTLSSPVCHGNATQILTGSALYYSRRRTLATANLIAFIVFTAWPLMAPFYNCAIEGDVEMGGRGGGLNYRGPVHFNCRMNPFFTIVGTAEMSRPEIGVRRHVYQASRA
jgi:hypothetical protein